MIPEWLYRSPSPITFAIYFAFTMFGYRKLSRGMLQFSMKWVVGNFMDALFVLGIPVLIGDALWCMFSMLRFGCMFPNDLLMMVFCIFRDVAGAFTCYLFAKRLFITNVIVLNVRFWTWLIIFNGLFLALWFGLASDPSFTDWTYAIRNGYGYARILSSLFISHGLGRVFTFMSYREMWTI